MAKTKVFIHIDPEADTSIKISRKGKKITITNHFGTVVKVKISETEFFELLTKMNEINEKIFNSDNAPQL